MYSPTQIVRIIKSITAREIFKRVSTVKQKLWTFDAEGNNIFGVKYPFESLNGTGKINNYHVRCISPEWMVKFHTGYTLGEKDYHDVLALCKYFNIPLLTEYEQFLKNK